MSREPFRVFVTGTDTGVGKTQVAAALCELLAKAGRTPAPFKPYESGVSILEAPADALRLRRAAKSRDPLSLICPHRFTAPLAPGMAARLDGWTPSFSVTLKAFSMFEGRSLVAEGAGGLFVPLDDEHDVIDLIAELSLPVVLVARAGLGTLNHTALSLDALAKRKLPVRAVVLVKSAPGDDPSEAHNAGWLSARHEIEVLGPVPYRKDEAARRRAFRDCLQPLLAATAK